MTLDISTAHNNARLAASAAFADTGAAPSRIRLYATAKPALGAEPGGAPLAEIVLAKPCGTVVNDVLVLQQQATGGDMIVATGSAVWARWINGEGELVADGVVSDAAGTGAFKLAGTSGTLLYQGAHVILGVTALS